MMEQIKKIVKKSKTFYEDSMNSMQEHFVEHMKYEETVIIA